MTQAEDMYPSVIEDVRRNLGLKPEDQSEDERIAQMTRREVFRRHLAWNGIFGYEGKILNAVSEIYQVELEEKH